MPGMLVRSFRCTQSSYDRRARLGGTQCTPSLPWSPPSALNRAPGHCTNRRIPTQKATERRCAMKAWLKHSALSAVVLAFLPLIELVSPAVRPAMMTKCQAAPRVDLAQSTALKSPDFQATARAFHACGCDALPARRPRPRPGNCGGAVEDRAGRVARGRR